MLVPINNILDCMRIIFIFKLRDKCVNIMYIYEEIRSLYIIVWELNTICHRYIICRSLNSDGD